MHDQDPAARLPIVRRAWDYPYDGYEGNFLFRGGALEAAPRHRLQHHKRVPVLAYASKRAPEQPARKFVDDCDGIAVEQVRAAGCDVIFVVRFSEYGIDAKCFWRLRKPPLPPR